MRISQRQDEDISEQETQDCQIPRRRWVLSLTDASGQAEGFGDDTCLHWNLLFMSSFVKFQSHKESLHWYLESLSFVNFFVSFIFSCKKGLVLIYDGTCHCFDGIEGIVLACDGKRAHTRKDWHAYAMHLPCCCCCQCIQGMYIQIGRAHV